MPRNLTFLCALSLFVSTSAFAQSRNSSAPPGSTLWDHNGSTVYLVANGSFREFYYDQPRPGMSESEARPGSLLFRGKSINGSYVGTAYIFNSRCGQIPYQVNGPILDNYERVVLQGNAPRVGSNCRIQGYIADTLEFTLLKPGAMTTTSSTADGAAHSENTQVDLDAIIGKWSDSDDRKSCDTPVGSSPDPVMIYQFSQKYFVYYEIECLIQDVTNRPDELVLNIDCLKAGHSRWFEKLTVRGLTRNRLSFRFWDHKPGFAGSESNQPIIVYRCPNDQQTESTERNTKTSQWSHNGSVMSFEEANGSLEIDYLEPRNGMMAVGVRTGTMLFLGTEDGDKIEGSAWTFDPRCGPLRYEVEGQLLNNGSRVALSGLSPRVNSNCDVIGQVPDVLRFELMP